MHDHTPIERKSKPIGLSEEAKVVQSRLFFGGSFDPPHLGHTQLPRQIARMIGKDTRVIYVPAARSPFKSSLPTANDHRTGMLEIALHNQCDWEIWEQELQDEPMNPDQPSYWADTWSIVQQMNLPGTNRFLIGADQMLSMHRWRRYEEFWKDAAVMLRQESDSVDTLIEQMIALDVWSDQNIEHWKDQIISVPTIDASSTSIRDAIMNPLTRNIPAEGLDPDVQAYILEHDLYCETD